LRNRRKQRSVEDVLRQDPRIGRASVSSAKPIRVSGLRLAPPRSPNVDSPILADPHAASLGAYLAHVRSALRGETEPLTRMGQTHVADAIQRAGVALIEKLLCAAPTDALQAMVERLDADLAEREQRQAEVNAAHPEDGTVLPEAQSLPPADAPDASPSPADQAGEGGFSPAPLGGSEEPSAADPRPTDTAEGSVPPVEGEPS
jgi:hypothetical protein